MVDSPSRKCLIVIAMSVFALLVTAFAARAQSPASPSPAEFNVLSYPGVDPTGSTDSSVGIESAIKAGCAYRGDSGYAKVIVPPGIYLIDPIDGNYHLTFTQDGTSGGIGCNNIEFVGLPGARSSTILRAGNSSMGAIITDAAPHSNLDIENITFDGNGSVLADPTIPGIGLISFLGTAGPLSNLVIRNNVFENLVSGTEALKLDDGIGNAPGGSVIVADNEFLNNTTNFGLAQDSGYGQEIFVMDHVADFHITGNYFSGNYSYSGLLGLYAYDANGEIDHNIFDNNVATTGDMYVQQSTNVLFDHNLDILPIDGSVAIRVVNSTNITIDGDDIIGGDNVTGSGTATGVVTLGGTYQGGDIVTVTIAPPNPNVSPIAISTTAPSSGSIGSLASGLTNAINQKKAYIQASNSGDEIDLSAAFVGPSANNILYSAASTGTVTISPTASTHLMGGVILGRFRGEE